MKEKLLREISFRTSKSSGPGGQHVNKTETRVELLWDINDSNALNESQKLNLRKQLKNRISEEGLLILTGQRSRSQFKNKEDVTNRFLKMIERYSKPPRKRIRTKPTRQSKEKRLQEKKIRAEKKLRRRTDTDF